VVYREELGRLHRSRRWVTGLRRRRHPADAPDARTGIDGVATARLVRENRPNQAIILSTADLDDIPERAADQAGVALCVGKVEGISTPDRGGRLGGDIRRLAGGLL
jgi:hypothetical protein